MRPGLGVVSAQARCPAGYEAVTGGYTAELPPEWHVVTDDRLGTIGWHVTATSAPIENPAHQAKIQVTAYCRSQ